MAKRIQRKRTKGYKMPSNAIYVGRPTKYGNPFQLLGDMIYCDASHRRITLPKWVIFDENNTYSKQDGLEKVVQLYRDWIFCKIADDYTVRPVTMSISDIKQELRGKDLACFCPLDSPCHADVLLKIANE